MRHHDVANEKVIFEKGMQDTFQLAEDVEQAKTASAGLGRFVRSLVGLDREAAKTALNRFTGGKIMRANQIEFLNLIIDHLTEHGVMDARLLYDSPFTDFSPRGVDGVFESKEVDQLVAILDDVRRRTVA